MERLTGRFGLSPEERRYWVFRHEMDHFSAWSHFFRFMLGHIFSALNEGFDDADQADQRIKEINCNCARNFIIAAARSHAFDEIRGAPLSGGKYEDFPFPQKEVFFWRAKQSGEMPIGFDEIDLALKLIGDREMAK